VVGHCLARVFGVACGDGGHDALVFGEGLAGAVGGAAGLDAGEADLVLDVDAGALQALFAQHDAFDFVLDRVEQFDEGAVWLHPEPSEPFRELTAAVWRRWPECPPYEGAHNDVVPHLTVSDEPVQVTVDVPIAARADAVTLIEEQADGRWLTRRRFTLG